MTIKIASLKESLPLLKTLLVLFLSAVVFGSPSLYAQESSSSGCPEIERKNIDMEAGLTNDERIALMEKQFLELVSSPVVCEESNSTASSSSSSQSSSDGGSQGQTSTASVSVQGNIESPPVESIASSPSDNADGSGKNQEALVKVDNTAALKAQLQAAIDAEEDPEVKRSLQNELNALK